jgi:TatD DNase family protein
MSPNLDYTRITTGIIDSHAHLLKEYFADEQFQMIERAFASNVRQIVNPGINATSLDELFEIADKYEHIYLGVGVHPHEANTWSPAVEDTLKGALARKKVVAVGECGLDFFYNHSSREEQIHAFRRQIELSLEFGKPLIIHCRDAWSDINLIFSDYAGKLTGVFHCFTGDLNVLKSLAPFDFYISFSGIVTFPNAKAIQEAARHVEIERLLVETDCPYLAPQAVRGQRNEPSYVWYVAEKLAELRQTSIEQVAAACSTNARRLFRLPEVASKTGG